MIATADDPVVVVFVQTDFTKGASGYTSRCRDQVRFFSSRLKTIVYSFYEDALRPWDANAVARFQAEFPHVELALDHRSKPLNALQRLKNLLIARAPGHAERIMRMRLPGQTPAYDRVARQHPGALLFANLSEAIAALNGMPFGRLVIDTHDIRFLKQALINGLPVFHPKAIATMRSETAVLSQADAVVAITPHEQLVFGSLLPASRVLYIPDFADRPGPPPLGTDTAFAHDLLFVGSEYAFNVEGLCDFLERHRTWLREHRIAVAGKVCEAPRVVALAGQLPSVRLLGFVDDLAQLYAVSKLAISPVRGTGLKIKILEALAAGVPVFASKESLAGLAPGYEQCAFPESAAGMARLLADPIARGAASAAAIRYARAASEAPDRLALLQLIGADGSR